MSEANMISEDEILYLSGKYTDFILHAIDGKRLNYRCRICKQSANSSYDKIKDNLEDGCSRADKHDQFISADDIIKILQNTHWRIYNAEMGNYFHKEKGSCMLECKHCNRRTASMKIPKLPKNKTITCNVCKSGAKKKLAK